MLEQHSNESRNTENIHMGHNDRNSNSVHCGQAEDEESSCSFPLPEPEQDSSASEGGGTDVDAAIQEQDREDAGGGVDHPSTPFLFSYTQGTVSDRNEQLHGAHEPVGGTHLGNDAATVILPHGAILYGKRNQASLTAAERFAVRLLDLLDLPKIPNYIFDETIKIIDEARLSDVDWKQVGSLRRSTCFASMFSRFKVPESVAQVVPIEDTKGRIGEGKESNVTIVVFDVEQQVMDIVCQDEEFSVLTNLAVKNKPSVWEQTGCRDGLCEEVMQGSVVQNYIHRNQLIPGTDLCVPIILYMDEINVTGNARVSMRPVLMALGIFNIDSRYLRQNTRVVGYIPAYDRRSSAQKNANNGTVEGKGRSVRNFHRCLGPIIDAVTVMQKSLASKKTCFRIGDELREVYLHCPLVFISGDSKEMDMVACRFGSYGSGMKRLSRNCCVSSLNSGTPGYNCRAVPYSLIKRNTCVVLNVCEANGSSLPPHQPTGRENADMRKQRSDTAKENVKQATKFLQNHSTYPCYNALWRTDLAGQEGLPLPHDPMHMFSTVCRTLFELTMACIPAGQRAFLDSLHSELFSEASSSGEKKAFPRMYFSRGFTSVTNLTCDEVTGTIIALLVTVKTDRGWEAISHAIDKRGRNIDKIANRNPKKGKQKGGRGKDRGRQTCSIGDAPITNNEDRTVIDNHRAEGEIAPTNNITLEQMLSLLEDLLEFYAWYKYGYPYHRHTNPPDKDGVFFWNKETEKRLRYRVTKIQEKIITYFPRQKGCGWKRQKFHDWLHFGEHITKYGLPSGYDTGWGESTLKWTAKGPAHGIKMQYDDSLAERTCHNLRETMTIGFACEKHDIERYRINTKRQEASRRRTFRKDRTWTDERARVEMEVKPNPMGRRWKINRNSNGDPTFSWVTNNKATGHGNQWVGFPKHIIDFLTRKRFNQTVGVIHGYCEIEITIKNKSTTCETDGRLLVRAHPDYRQKGPWYEWCLVNYETEHGSVASDEEDPNPGETDVNAYPSKILAMFRIDDSEHIECLIHPCVGSDHKSDGRLTEVWTKDYTKPASISYEQTNGLGITERITVSGARKPRLEIVWAAAILRRIFVVEESSRVSAYLEQRKIDARQQSTKIIYIRDMEEYWARSFDRTMRRERDEYLAWEEEQKQEETSESD